ncbi:uncharacterized protein B0T15DRAFT_223896 [Chaetomium strumarium]|uniref:Uncharacterized protein n=1 Tax=Chaetomium strumarium TaxID=1170767 RepID=A0AAJ0GPW2_9PEZI|nr:hypothetical protein B0T15DRAFT_223896 [Chaetomium strumarium]
MAGATMYTPETTWTRLFLSVAVVQGLVAASLEAYVLIAVQRCFAPPVVQVRAGHTVPMFFALFIFGFVYQLLLVYDALRSSNMIQAIGLCLYNLCLLIYAIFQPVDIKASLDSLAGSRTGDNQPLLTPGTDAWGDSKPALIAVAIVVALATSLLCFAAHKLRSEFAWFVYKVTNADLPMKRRVLILQVVIINQAYVALLKFDVFFLLGFLVQNAVNASANMGDPEFGLSIAVLPVVCLVVWLAVACALRENKVGTLAVILGYLAAAAFLSWKLATLPRRISMLVAFAAITLVMTLCTIVMAVLCLANFGKGVMKFTQSQHRQAGHGYDSHYLQETDYASLSSGYAPRRLSLD